MAATRVLTRDTIDRHLAMLARIPVKGWIDTTTLCDRLRAAGYVFTTRQIQSDLAKYHAPGSQFPLECNAKTTPYQYRWRIGAKLSPVPVLDVQAAVAVDLVRRYLEPALPPSTLEYLQPYFDEARRRLLEATGSAAKLARWSKKILVVPEGPQRPPSIDKDIQRTVYDALLHDRCLRVKYRRRDGKVLDYLLNPLGILSCGPVHSLVCTMPMAAPARRSKPLTFHLHRMEAAAPDSQAAVVPAGFDLKAFAASDEYEYRLGDDIRLLALVNADAVVSLEERKLVEGQMLTPSADGRFLLDATVPYTYALQVWLLGFAEGIEVLEPKKLRDEVARKLTQAAARYQPTGSTPARLPTTASPRPSRASP